MSFRKFQIIDPNLIGCPEDGHVYFGRDTIGWWEKRSNCYWEYINTGGTSGGGGSSGVSGTSGISGEFYGTSGSSGESGTSGVGGSSGTSGKGGVNGTFGTSGSSGVTGTSGTSGKDGLGGSAGTSGTSNSSGMTGSAGTSGFGSSGTSGLTGSSGTAGADGAYGGATRTWVFYNTTDPDVGRFYSMGQTDISLITNLIINISDYDGQDVNAWLSTWTSGLLKIEKWGDASIFGIYDGCSSSIYGPNRYQISNMNPLNASGSLVNGTRYLLSFVKSGGGGTGSSGTSGSGTSNSEWTNFGTVTIGSTSTFTVTNTPINQEIFKIGRPIRHNAGSGSNNKYAIVTNYSTGTVTIAGISTGGGASMDLDYGLMSYAHEICFVINGNYADSTDNTLLENDLLMKNGYYWTKGDAYIVSVKHIVGSKGSGTAPTINVSVVDVGDVLNAPASVDTSLVSSNIDINSTNYILSLDRSIEIKTSSITGVSGNPRDLVVYLTIIEK